MKRGDIAALGGLTVLALFLWLRDRAWMTDAADTLPILIGLPLFVWLGAPWRFRTATSTLSATTLALPILSLLLGVAGESSLFLTFGWLGLFWRWLAVRIEHPSPEMLRRLMVFPLLSFPWIALDGQALGWWFRLSGAWATTETFRLIGFQVMQEGTSLLVQGLPISVAAPCAGMNTLQAMLLAGSVLTFLYVGKKPRYWLHLLLLVALSWLANTLRIIALCAAALSFGVAFAMGSFHKLGGSLVLVLMFLLCWRFYEWQVRSVV